MAEYPINKGVGRQVEFKGLGGALVALTFRLNRKYGAYGLMKLLAARRHPRRIVSRKSVARILNRH